MPHSTPEKRRAYNARPEVRARARERDRNRYLKPERQAWIAEFQQTPAFKEANYAHVKAWRKRPENKPKRAVEAKNWRKRHPETFLAIKRRHRANNIDKIRERERVAQAESRKNNPEGQQRRVRASRARKFALQEELMGRPRPDRCELCDEGPNGHHKMIVYDHCHKTNAPRGWLCDRCNKVLGLVRDNSNLLMKMAAYLAKVKAKFPGIGKD